MVLARQRASRCLVELQRERVSDEEDRAIDRAALAALQHALELRHRRDVGEELVQSDGTRRRPQSQCHQGASAPCVEGLQADPSQTFPRLGSTTVIGVEEVPRQRREAREDGGAMDDAIGAAAATRNAFITKV